MSGGEGHAELSDGPGDFETLNLADEEPVPSIDPSFRFKSRSIKQRQEDTRARLAFVLVMLLAVLTLFSVVMASLFSERTESIIEILKLVFTPIVGLVGSALGFYFGGIDRHADEETRDRAK